MSPSPWHSTLSGSGAAGWSVRSPPRRFSSRTCHPWPSATTPRSGRAARKTARSFRQTPCTLGSGRSKMVWYSREVSRGDPEATREYIFCSQTPIGAPVGVIVAARMHPPGRRKWRLENPGPVANTKSGLGSESEGKKTRRSGLPGSLKRDGPSRMVRACPGEPMCAAARGTPAGGLRLLPSPTHTRSVSCGSRT